MRNKKDLAIGVKFVANCNDAITNMEGAMHSFITPILRTSLHGDYRWDMGHGTHKFSPEDGKQRARIVILSAAIQPDFETNEVMISLCGLQAESITGKELPSQWTMPSIAEKQDSDVRAAYDLALKKHMIAHLTSNSRLPASSSVVPIAIEVAIKVLNRHIAGIEPRGSFDGLFVQLCNRSRSVIAIEILYMVAIQQLHNELSALEYVAAEQGYVYTYDPAAIFAAELGGDATLLNRVMLAALQKIVNTEPPQRMMVFAFNDYKDADALFYAKKALHGLRRVQVVAKNELFNNDSRKVALGYQPLPQTEGALLVLHNNSDGFGQNIEFEDDGGSMDGAIGMSSSAAASLQRERRDLLDYLL